MTATTEALNTESRPCGVRFYGLASSAVLFAGALVCFDDDGYLDDGADTADFLFAGVARDSADNTDGADEDIGAEVYTTGEFLFDSVALSDDDVGQPVYLLDNATVVLGNHADLDEHIYVGRIVEVVSATRCWVSILPAFVEEGRQYTVRVAGVNAGALDLSTAAEDFGGSDFYVKAIQAVEAYVTAGGASAGLLATPANYTLANGAVSTADDQSANTLVITFTGVLHP